ATRPRRRRSPAPRGRRPHRAASRAGIHTPVARADGSAHRVSATPSPPPLLISGDPSGGIRTPGEILADDAGTPKSEPVVPARVRPGRVMEGSSGPVGQGGGPAVGSRRGRSRSQLNVPPRGSTSIKATDPHLLPSEAPRPRATGPMKSRSVRAAAWELRGPSR